MKKNICRFFIVSLFFSTHLSAQSSAGKDGAAFLNIPVGAGPSSLGGAYTALAKDAYAPFYNPAGLPWVSEIQLATQHLDYVENVNAEFASLVIPFHKKHGIGAAFEYVGSGKINRTDQNGVKTDYFSNDDLMVSFSYGYRTNDRVSFGVTGKTIHSRLDTVSSQAYAIDAGFLWNISEKFHLGGGLSNLGSKLKFVQQKDSLPMAYKAAIVYYPSKNIAVTMEEISRSKVFSTHGGVQWKPLSLLALRAGYRTDTVSQSNAQAGLCFGLGLELWGQELSYAYLPLNNLGQTNYFSFLFRFF